MSQEWWQNCTEVKTLSYLSFKITNKTFLVKIEVCGENVRFLNIGENTKESLINFPD